jgi:hypothetical protein
MTKWHLSLVSFLIFLAGCFSCASTINSTHVSTTQPLTSTFTPQPNPTHISTPLVSQEPVPGRYAPSGGPYLPDFKEQLNLNISTDAMDNLHITFQTTAPPSYVVWYYYDILPKYHWEVSDPYWPLAMAYPPPVIDNSNQILIRGYNVKKCPLYDVDIIITLPKTSTATDVAINLGAFGCY